MGHSVASKEELVVILHRFPGPLAYRSESITYDYSSLGGVDG